MQAAGACAPAALPENFLPPIIPRERRGGGESAAMMPPQGMMTVGIAVASSVPRRSGLDGRSSPGEVSELRKELYHRPCIPLAVRKQMTTHASLLAFRDLPGNE